MTRIESVILYLLSRAKQKGKNNLSKTELFKLLYLLEVESYKFTGRTFFDSAVTFVRDKNGPISVSVYRALSDLNNKHIKIEEKKRDDYPYTRHCISIKKDIKKINLQDSERLFINSVLESYLTLTISKLKSVAYSTEPMKEIQKEEKRSRKSVLKGHQLDFSLIPLDEDIVDLVAG